MEQNTEQFSLRQRKKEYILGGKQSVFPPLSGVFPLFQILSSWLFFFLLGSISYDCSHLSPFCLFCFFVLLSYNFRLFHRLMSYKRLNSFIFVSCLMPISSFPSFYWFVCFFLIAFVWLLLFF